MWSSESAIRNWAISFYTEVLGMELVNFLEEMQMAFFSFGERDHDLAVIKVPEDAPVGSSGLAHTAFEIEGGLEQLGELQSRCGATASRSSSPRTTCSRRACTTWIPTATRGALLAGHVSRRGQGYLHQVRVPDDVMRQLDLEVATS